MASLVFTLARALTYATLFVGLLGVFLPSRLLDATGVTRPAPRGGVEIAAIVVTLAGAAVVLWSILAFVFMGQRGCLAARRDPCLWRRQHHA